MVHCGIITLHFSLNTEIEVGVKNEFPPHSGILTYFTVFIITKVNVSHG